VFYRWRMEAESFPSKWNTSARYLKGEHKILTLPIKQDNFN
jgi:hypothetical protein